MALWVIHESLPLLIFDTTIRNIVSNSIIEQDAVLRYDSDIGSKVVDRHVGDVLTVNVNFTSIYFIESVQQPHDG
jgi:hypothetical protein